jgi:uncharacterized protein YceK
MKTTIFRFCIVVIFVFLAQGCTSPNAAKITSTTSPAQVTEKSISSNNLILEQIITLSPEQNQSPEQTVLSSLQWKMSNKKITLPSKESILSSIVFGTNSVISLKVPGTTSTWYNFILLKNNEQKWSIFGIMDMPTTGEMKTEKYGLALPMDNFVVSKLTVSEPKPENIWAFANESKYVILGKYPREPLTPPSGSEKISLNGNEAWLNMDNGNTFFFYFDKEYLVWVSGNITKEEMQKLASSLPSVETSTFPVQTN